jgi:hypothetical protein
VVLNAATGTYTVHRVPKRSLDEVLKSLAGWRHQELADDSTADFSAEDGILSMDCSACGLSRPSAIDIGVIDLDTIMAYEAGAWHIGVRSKDGAQDFFGVLRGELGPEPHDPARVSEDRRRALVALADLYDLAYLTQHPVAATPAAPPAAPPAASRPGTDTAAAQPTKPQATQPTKPSATQTPKPPTISLDALAASGDVEGIQARRGKADARAMAHALETAYGVRARTQMLAGQIDAALKTLQAGRQSFGKSATLRDLEAHYVVIGDAYDRLRLAVKLSVGDLRSYLQQIHTLEPGDATGIGQMLARVLANHIADQRAAGRSGIADELLAAGRDLFPDSAEDLGRGTPGVLPAE